MFHFLLGLGSGVYIGTVYDCRSTLKFTKKLIKDIVPEEAFPKKKDDDDN